MISFGVKLTLQLQCTLMSFKYMYTLLVFLYSPTFILGSGRFCSRI